MAGLTKVKGSGLATGAATDSLVGIADNSTSTAITIDSAERVGLGTDNMQMYNVGGGNSTLVVTAISSATNVLANTDSNITIANGDGTADNTAALHFAREDTDGAPNYVGASVVSQFKETQVTGQYPKADLAFLTSTATNTAPSEKMRIDSSGNVGIGTSSFPVNGTNLKVEDATISRLVLANTGDSTFEFGSLSGGHLNIYDATADAERMRIDSAGNVKVNNGNLVIGTAGKGIDFSADGNATGMSSEVLDDYEEGTFTPAYTSIGTGTYDAQRGFYTKIGNQVSCHIFLDIGSQGTASGSIAISGLPFTSINTSYRYGSTSSIHGTSWSTPTAGLNGLVGSNSTNITIYKNMATTSSYSTNITHIGTGNLLLSLVYSAA